MVYFLCLRVTSSFLTLPGAGHTSKNKFKTNIRKNLQVYEQKEHNAVNLGQFKDNHPLQTANLKFLECRNISKKGHYIQYHAQ